LKKWHLHTSCSCWNQSILSTQWVSRSFSSRSDWSWSYCYSQTIRAFSCQFCVTFLPASKKANSTMLVLNTSSSRSVFVKLLNHFSVILSNSTMGTIRKSLSRTYYIHNYPH
jgi:hypothetical protein